MNSIYRLCFCQDIWFFSLSLLLRTACAGKEAAQRWLPEEYMLLAAWQLEAYRHRIDL
jgi:hypothetical protein